MEPPPMSLHSVHYRNSVSNITCSRSIPSPITNKYNKKEDVDLSYSNSTTSSVNDQKMMTSSKRPLQDSSTDNISENLPTSYFKKSKHAQSFHTTLKEDCNSTSSSDNDKQSSIHEIKNYNTNCETMGTPVLPSGSIRTNGLHYNATRDSAHYPSLPSHYFDFNSFKALNSLNNAMAVRKSENLSKLQQLNELSTTKQFKSLKQPTNCSNIQEEDNEQEETGIIGSELLIAAYNNFVRKLVDETLDRTITFCEQPRNAISTLERICAKAWPQLESKRHRNRIRAYLKACRRNSKKNRGQINMKEPPMNGLSVEARQMVSSALSLVTKDIEQMRNEMKKDHNGPLFSINNETSSCLNSLRKQDSLFSQRHETNCFESSTTKSTLPVGKSAFIPNFDEKSYLKTSPTNSQFPLICSGYGITNGCKNTISHSPSNPVNSYPNLKFGFDQDCMSAMMRLFPTAFHLNSAFGLDFGTALRYNALHASMPPSGNIEEEVNSSYSNANNLSRNPFQMANLNSKFISSLFNPLFRHSSELTDKKSTDDGKTFRPAVGNDAAQKSGGKGFEETVNMTQPYPYRGSHLINNEKHKHAAPLAHFATAKYSATLNEATARLLDVRPITRDDMAYFQHYQNIMHEALEYVRGVSQMLLKKAEILEGHFNAYESTFTHPPLNFSNQNI